MEGVLFRGPTLFAECPGPWITSKQPVIRAESGCTREQHVVERSRCWVVGWYIPDLDTALPKLVSADVTISAQKLQTSEILALEVNVVGRYAQTRPDILGFPIIARHQFGSSTRIEIEAFVVS
jgi:hypothetical protein